MSIIQYRSPQTLTWARLNRWSNLGDDLDALFETPSWANSGRQSQPADSWMPALDLYQSKENIVARLELPGMKKEEIEISLHDGVLTFSGELKAGSEKKEKAERTECYVGRFRRSVRLPTQVDAAKVNATYRDGILTVTLPKADEAKPKQIQVNVE